MKIEKTGFLRISNEADRITIAGILFKNGYSASPVRLKKNGRTAGYGIRYCLLENIDEVVENES